MSSLTVESFRVKASEAGSAASARSAEQALDSFIRFIEGERGAEVHTFEPDDFSERSLGEWVTQLFALGYSFKTVVFYVNRLSALYGKVATRKLEPSVPTDELQTESLASAGFPALKARLKRAGENLPEVNLTADVFGGLRKLVLADFPRNAALQLGRDLVLFAVCLGGLSFEELGRYKKDDYQGENQAVRDIVARYSCPRNKYLFPLGQAERTPGQLRRFTAMLFEDALGSAGIRLGKYDSSLGADLWALVALRCGIPAGEVAGCLERKIDGAESVCGDDKSCSEEEGRLNPAYSFAERKLLTAERRAEITDYVAGVLSRDPEEWFAMQFRPGVDYERVRSRMDAEEITFSKEFYPVEEVVRRVGKKLLKKTRPVVPGLLFFKSRASELTGLYARIGDLAWGYRYDKKAGGRYAVIAESAIRAYQAAIGQFVDSIDETSAEGQLRFEPGDSVEIVGGDFSGRMAVFEKEIVRSVDEGGRSVTKVVSRLRLSGAGNFTWTVDLDPRQLAPAKEK